MGCSPPNWRPSSSACRPSPSKFTVFRVVAKRAVHTRIGTVVRALPMLTVEIHSVWSRRGASCPHPHRHPHSSVCHHSPSKFTAFRVSAGGDIHTRIGVPFDRATARTKAGRTCGYHAAESTHDPVHPEGEGKRRSGEAGMRRCGYLLPASNRRAVHFNGERRNPLELRTD